MSFSINWQKDIYSKGFQFNSWPWSDLVSLIYRFVDRSSGKIKLLEIGVGTGPNVPLYESLQFQTYGIDGSESAIQEIIRRYPHLMNNFHCADFTIGIPIKEKMDVVIDRASLVHNDYLSIQSTVANISKILKKGGYFIAVDWFGSEHEACQLGEEANGDPKLRDKIERGTFKGVGKVYFFTQEKLLQLFSGEFEILHLEKKTRESTIGNLGYQKSQMWDIVLKKK